MPQPNSIERRIQIEAFVNSREASKLSIGGSVELRFVGPLQEALPPVSGRLVKLSPAENSEDRGQVRLEIELSIKSLSLIANDLRQPHSAPHDCSLRVQGNGPIILGQLTHLPGDVPSHVAT